jgi:hypothetical protein
MHNSTMRVRAGALLLAAGFGCFLGTAVHALPAGRELSSLVVEEGEGLERKDWPLTFGFPLPPGEVTDAGEIAVIDAAGHLLPVQTRALARWPDGSARWVLVDTQVSLAPRGTGRLRLVTGSPAAPGVRLHVGETAERVTVDTGVLRFEIPKSEFAVLSAVATPGGRPMVAGPMVATLTSTRGVLRAGAPASVTVLENGPLRARIALSGTYGEGLDYLIRIEAYAGQPFVRILHTFVNRNPAPHVQMHRLRIEVPLAPRGEISYAFGLDGGRTRSGRLPKQGLGLVQEDNLTFRAGDERQSGRLAGWVALRAKQANAGMAGRWFWQEYPKAIEARPDSLVYDLWPAEVEPAKVGIGASKTHELTFWAASGESQRGAAAPLVARLDPDWVARTGALPHALSPSGPAAGFVAELVAAAERYLKRNARERWDDRRDVRCEGADGERPRLGAYGMWNWGDWNFPKYHDAIKGCDAWGNLEYDTTQVLALAFASSGREFLHEAMVAAARHFMDVDVIRFLPSRPDWVGMNHPKNPLHWSFELGGVDLGHTWTEGLLSYHFLTGDERGLETARGIADYLTARIRGFVRGNPRQWGWPQIALVATYDATGEERYLEAARAYARGGMAAHEPTAIEKWKLGILADGLAYTHARTGDEEIEAWLRRYAEAVARRKVTLDARLFPALAYLAGKTGDRELKAAALERAAKLDLGSWGKPFTINGRIGLRIHSLLATSTGPVEEPTRAPLATPDAAGSDAPALQLTTSPLR